MSFRHAVLPLLIAADVLLWALVYAWFRRGYKLKA